MAAYEYEESPTDRLSFVTIGTPCEVPDEDEELRHKVQTQDQVVTDQQGRRRFHGAFTGGFSAGYYNTVGSKEGWTPATFKSSRSDRAAGKTSQAKQQRPEDFMDEEDMADFGIAPKQVRSTEAFSQGDDGQSRKRNVDMSRGEEHLESLLKPPSTSIGERLLKLMGWKHGQGVGPRVEPKRRVKGPSLPDAMETDEQASMEDLAAELGATFAPRDVEMKRFQPKNNRHGIGYSGIRAEDFHLGTSTRGLGAGIGVGALEEDDEDVYDDADDRSQYNRMLTAGDEETGMSQKRYGPGSLPAIGGPSDMPPPRGQLPGFTPASIQRTKRKVYPGPKVPEDFDPFIKFDKPGPLSSGLLRALQAPKHQAQNLTAEDRARFLGEQRLQLPGAGTDPAAAQPGAKFWPVQQSEQEPAPPERSTVPLTSREKLSELTGDAFKPFKNNPDKQYRYEQFLRGRRVRPKDMPEWELQAELKEFKQAKVIYRPMSKVMALRFQPASGAPATSAPKGSAADSLSSSDQASKPPETKPLLRVGKSNRLELEWHPHSRVCKRFGCPDPYPHSGIVGLAVGSEALARSGVRASSDWQRSIAAAFGTTPSELMNMSAGQAAKSKQASTKSEPESLIKVPADMQETPEAVGDEPEPVPDRPSIDIFKAIFSGSESESDSGSESDADAKRPATSGQTARKAPQQPTNVDQTGSPRANQGVRSGAKSPRLRRAIDRDEILPTIIGAGSDDASEDSDGDIGPQPLAHHQLGQARPQARAATQDTADESTKQRPASPVRAPPSTAIETQNTVEEDERLSLVHFHPLAARSLPSVSVEGDRVNVVRPPSDDDEWVEAPHNRSKGDRSSKDKRRRKKKKKRAIRERLQRDRQRRNSSDDTDDDDDDDNDSNRDHRKPALPSDEEILRRMKKVNQPLPTHSQHRHDNSRRDSRYQRPSSHSYRERPSGSADGDSRQRLPSSLKSRPRAADFM